MTNLSKVSQDEVSKNQVIRSNVAKTQQPDAERLIYIHKLIHKLESYQVKRSDLENSAF